MLTRALREENHGVGFFRISASAGIVIVGEGDGTVKAYNSSLKSTTSSNGQIWTHPLTHTGQVTAVLYSKVIDSAFSCGRDGKVFVHMKASSRDPPTQIQLLSVTGELNSMAITPDGRRLILGGDSVRCYVLDVNKVHTVPMTVQNPIVSVAVSDDGNYIAMASADGSVGVVSFSPPNDALPPLAIRSILPRIMPVRKPTDLASIKMCWVSNQIKSTTTLFIPTNDGVQIHRLQEDMAARLEADTESKKIIGRLHFMGTVGADGPRDTCNVIGNQISKHKTELILSGKENKRIVCIRVDDSSSKLKENIQLTTELNSETGHLCDTSVDSFTGVLAAVDTCGVLGVQKNFASQSRDRERESTCSNLAQETELEIGNLSQSARKKVNGESSHEEDTASVVQDLIKSNPNYIADVATLKRKEKERRGMAKNEIRREMKRPSFVDDEAEERSSIEESESFGEEESERSFEDSDEEAEQLEKMYRRRYGLNKTHKTAKQSTIENFENQIVDNSVEPLISDSPQVWSRSFSYAIHVGSTPYLPVEKEGRHHKSDSRYLSFNSIGALRVTPEALYVHFHDMTRSTIKINEKRQAIIGALGIYAFSVILSVPKSSENCDGEEKTQHVLYYRPFKGLGLQSDWSLTLPSGEYVMNMAIGNRYVAVFTNAYLRVFSPSGLELAVLSFPNNVVAATGYNSIAHAQKDSNHDPLCIAFSDEAGSLFITVLDVSDDGNPTIPPTPCPLTVKNQSERATLQWLGWSDEGVIHTADSLGVVRRLHRTWGISWVPVYDPTHRYASDEKNWIWGVASSYIMAYKCIGDEICPQAFETLPSVSRLQICLPLLRTSGDKPMLSRDSFLRQYIETQDKKLMATHYDATLAGLDAILDNELLKQFQQAVQDGKSSRAVDIAAMFQLLATLEEAARYANEKQERLVTEKVLGLTLVRKKMKKKRLCKLPFVSDISDKERDRVIKKLIDQEKEGRPQPGTLEQVSAQTPQHPHKPDPVNLLTSPPRSKNATLAHQQSPQVSKRVVFDIAEALPSASNSNGKKTETPASTTHSSESSLLANSSASTSSPQVHKKTQNPFAKAFNAAPPPNTSSSPSKHQSLLPLAMKDEHILPGAGKESPQRKHQRTETNPVTSVSSESLKKPSLFSIPEPIDVDRSQTQQFLENKPIFNNITVRSDPFASMCLNESSVSEEAPLTDIGHLGNETSATLLAALKRVRENDEDEGEEINLMM